ncbi:unnamed protein product, partial [Ectocarpus sp. 4 AP-2014]
FTVKLTRRTISFSSPYSQDAFTFFLRAGTEFPEDHIEVGRLFPVFERDGTSVRGGTVIARPNVGDQLSDQAQELEKEEEEVEEEEEEEEEEEAGSRAIGHRNLKRKGHRHPQPARSAGPAIPTARHADHPDNQGGSAGGVHPEAARHRVGGDAAAHFRSQMRPPPLRGSATTWVVPCARWTAETSRRSPAPLPESATRAR